MNILFCDNCSFQLEGEEDFCPKCEIAVNPKNIRTEDYNICPVCEAENPKSERKCSCCCSIILDC